MADPPEEAEYWSLLESQKQQYPDFVQHLSGQEDFKRDEGRMAVIEFQDAARPSVQRLHTVRKLRRHLNNHTSTGVAQQRIFVLEGLPRNFIQVLGARLKAPPAFFASHWAAPGTFIGNLLNRDPRHYDRQSRFILGFPRLHLARIKKEKGDDLHPSYYMDTSIRRPLSSMTLFGDFDGPLTSFEQLSFWSTRNGQSWDAIVLVDPPLGKYVRWKQSPIQREVIRDPSIQLVDLGRTGLAQHGSWFPSCTYTSTLGPSSANWKCDDISPGMQSMFDDILLLYPSVERRSDLDPKNYMDICRRIVLSAWTARLRIAEAQIIMEQCRMSLGDRTIGMNASNAFDKSWAQPWSSRDFGRLVRGKSVLESIDWELYRNMDALNFSGAQSTESWEKDSWISLQRHVRSLKTRLDNISQSYMQAVSIRESITANKQAQQVGFLTSLATFFIPLSFVAGIFSMGGEFSAGANHFWVYWAIAAPMALVACFLLFTNHGRRVVGNVSVEKSLV